MCSSGGDTQQAREQTPALAGSRHKQGQGVALEGGARGTGVMWTFAWARGSRPGVAGEDSDSLGTAGVGGVD